MVVSGVGTTSCVELEVIGSAEDSETMRIKLGLMELAKNSTDADCCIQCGSLVLDDRI